MNDCRLPLGVIFDMDGVLADSEGIICKAACQMFAEHGLAVQATDFIPFVVVGERRCITGIAEKYNFSIDPDAAKKRTYDIYLDMIKGTLQPLPGAHEFIATCRSLGKKIAVASSAEQRKVQGNLAELNLTADCFDAVVTGEDVEHKKPAPDVFLLAAKRLGVDPKHCLVIEDAVSGVAAAKAAGAKCLALTSSFAKEHLEKADYWAANLAEAPPEVLDWSRA